MEVTAPGKSIPEFPTTVTDMHRVPVSAAERISAIDMLRGVAVLGILMLNVLGFGLPHQAYDDPSVAGGATGINLVVWAGIAIVAEGKMRAIFSLLFGAGVILLTSRIEARGAGADVADVYYRRNLWLMAFGIVHGYLMLWTGDILYMYGLTALFLFPFRRLAPRILIALGIVVLAVVIPKDWLSYHHLQVAKAKAETARTAKAVTGRLTEEQEADIRAWTDRLLEMKPDAKALEKEIRERRAGYLSNVATLAPVNANWQSSFYYLWGFWDVAAMMLIGMALVKTGFLSGTASSRTYVLTATGGYLVGVPLTVARVWTFITSGFAAGAWYPSPWPGTYEFARLAMVLGHVSVLLLFFRSRWLPWLTGRLAAVGQIALTNYLMQTVICVVFFYGVGLGVFGRLQRYQLYYVVAGIWIAELAWSQPWLKIFRFGPVEWLWRSLTYLERQPFRLGRLAPTPPSALAS
jgi:uncharacterized protein